MQVPSRRHRDQSIYDDSRDEVNQSYGKEVRNHLSFNWNSTRYSHHCCGDIDRPEEGTLCPGPGLVNGPFLWIVRETI
jgi:hypothetical protein